MSKSNFAQFDDRKVIVYFFIMNHTAVAMIGCGAKANIGHHDDAASKL